MKERLVEFYDDRFMGKRMEGRGWAGNEERRPKRGNVGSWSVGSVVRRGGVSRSEFVPGSRKLTSTTLVSTSSFSI